MKYIYFVFNYILNFCYSLSNNYALAILLFTLLSKVVLLPLFLWTYFNSIKMAKMQPEINNIKIEYYGQKDCIAEEQTKLFKKYKYNPIISVIPLLVQLFILIGVVGAIKMSINNPNINMQLGIINLGSIPHDNGFTLIWSPVIAALSSLLLCLVQNKYNVLQEEQSKFNKYIVTVLSVGLSLYLGWFVAIGTALYWVFSNLFAIIQLVIFNLIFKPQKQIDYNELKESRKKLDELNNIGKAKKDKNYYINKKRENADYKRFFSVVNKHLVFYSESNGFYKYYKGYIDFILKKTNITIHYITSDPNDNIFEMEKNNPQIRAYYIGEKKLITLMMRMDADIVVMTVPDLDTYHIKKSYVKKDIEYIYIQHGMGSVNMALRKGALDHFDTVFSSNKSQTEEIRALEKLNGLKEKTVLECGYPLLDDMKIKYNEIKKDTNEKPYILIGPSWQKDNIVDSCLDELLDQLEKIEYRIIVRPHPQHVRHNREKLEAIKEKYKNTNIEVQLDFSSTDTVWNAELLICDWSDLAMEYAFCTKKPVLFIDTPMKVMNPDYTKIDIIPINIRRREIIGTTISPKELNKVTEAINMLLMNKEYYSERILEFEEEQVYNIGNSAEVGGKYIVDRLLERKKNKS